MPQATQELRDVFPLSALAPALKTFRPPAPAQLDRISYDRFSDEQWRYYLYVYYRQIEMADADIGRVLDAIDDSGEADGSVQVRGIRGRSGGAVVRYEGRPVGDDEPAR